MDSVTHVILGGALGVAVMGRRIAPWKAALWGAACNTLPDLDVFIDHGDAVSNMVLHRGHTHSLFWLALLSPLLALAAARLMPGGGFRRWWLATGLALLTHPLLDLMTVYGTRLLLPFDDHPWAVGSLFIIDPLVTLPLLVGLGAALWRRGPQGERWNLAGLAVSALYVAWSMVAQQQVEGVALASARIQGLSPQRVLVTPAPLNTLLWRVVLVQDGQYHEGFRSLLDRGDTMAFERFDRGTATLAPLLHPVKAVQAIRDFSHGFYKLGRAGDDLLITDLRMGQEPQYVFGFVVARQQGDGPVQPLRPQQVSERIDTGRALAWLLPRMLGRPLPPPR